MSLNRVPAAVVLALFVLPVMATGAGAQCILANPSFEILGSGGEILGGWNHFGSTGWTDVADHGSKAALVQGPDSGDPGISGYWQGQDCVAGEQWHATGRVRHASLAPLTGTNHAMVNIEWRGAADELIDYDTFAVADAGSPTDEYLDFDVLSSPAPVGTVGVRIVLAVYQQAGSPAPEIYYDDITFYSTSSPTIDDVQWNDFPGGRTVAFGGYTWRVKGPGIYGPGPNRFCDGAECVWVDPEERLHISLQRLGGSWYSTEVVLEEALGYGDYVLTTEGRLDQIDPNVVLGIFLWQYGPCWDPSYLWWNAFNEIDIEYSRWGNPGNAIGQFVAQPYDYPGNIRRFDHVFSEGEIVSHAMRWLPDRVEYRVWRGGAADESPQSLIHAWTYDGPHIPRPDQPRMHLNLWQFGSPPSGDQEVVFTDFNFTAEDDPSTGLFDDPANGSPVVTRTHLFPAVPNPFNPSTTISFELDRAGPAVLTIFDVAGRRVRTLVNERRTGGRHDVVWDGRDDAGTRVASGVYLVRLQGDQFVETRRVALIK